MTILNINNTTNITDYANSLSVDDISIAGAVMLLPLNTSSFVTSRPPNPGTIKILEKSIIDTLIDCKLPSKYMLDAERCAVLMMVNWDITKAHKTADDPWLEDLVKILEVCKILDYGVSMDFLVAMVEWVDTLYLLHDSAKDPSGGFKDKANVIVNRLKMLSMGCGCFADNTRNTSLDDFEKWVESMDPFALPLQCTRGIECKHHSHLSKSVDSSSKNACCEPFTPPRPKTMSDSALLDTVMRSFKY